MKLGKAGYIRSRMSSGITLVELLTIVIIVGILVALAIPGYLHTTVRSKQSEGQLLLKQIFTLQQAYLQQHNTYALNGVDASNIAPNAYGIIGVEIGLPARYSYHMVSTRTTFTCTATANLDDDATNDVWIIDNTGALSNSSNDASN